MTSLNDTAQFGAQLRECVETFRRQETLLREQYAQAPGGPEKVADLLERSTRRYLIDGLLQALDWNVDDPAQIAEEARSTSATGRRLYFDYLGVAPRAQAPVLLCEAKGFDVPLPRKANGPELEPGAMAELIAKAIEDVKRGQKNSSIVSQWAEFLTDLYGYISSLDDLGRRTLRRAAITAGGWIIVFLEPVTAFQPWTSGTEGLVTSANPAPAPSVHADHIVCFTSLDDMLNRHPELFKLLHRTRLVDTLPLTLTVTEALAMIPPDRVGACYQSVLVSTSTKTGALRKPHPTRSVYPALVIETGSRWFAIVDYDRGIDEPRGASSITHFLSELTEKGTALLTRLRQRLGLPLVPETVDHFPGFADEPSRSDPSVGMSGPVAGSTADRMRAADAKGVIFVCGSGEVGAVTEFVVVTGIEWFYKSELPTGAACDFHFWKAARGENVAAPELHTGYVGNSFTEDGQDRHCAQHDLFSLREARCHIRPIETHLCCRACIYAANCWATDPHRLPCPDEDDSQAVASI